MRRVAGLLGRGALVLALCAGLTGAALAQAQLRAEPITGPGVTTIGNIDRNARVNLRAGPSSLFPSVGTLNYGTRVQRGYCIGGGSARWCQVETMDGRLSGYVSGRFLVEGAAPRPPDAGDGGPDYWAVRGLGPGQRLNVRRDPSPRAPALATLGEGEVVHNLGCRETGQGRWCQIRSTTGMDVTGWVAGRYLRESSGPPAGGGWGGGSGAAGPDFWAVSGIGSGQRLNVRREPSPRAPVLGTLGEGEVVRNLGCRGSGQDRWCQIRSTRGMDVTGWVAGRYLREAVGPPAGGGGGGSWGGGSGAHGPDFFVVSGLAAGDVLNVRVEPSAQGQLLATLQPGARVENLGCRMVGQARWCRIRTTGGVSVTGWVNGRYLREG
jgi:uncharacterized protein YraI